MRHVSGRSVTVVDRAKCRDTVRAFWRMIEQ